MLKTSPAVADFLSQEPAILKSLPELMGQTRPVNDLVFASDGRQILVGGSRYPGCWDFRTGAFEFAVPEAGGRLAYAPKGEAFAPAVPKPRGSQPVRSAHPSSVVVYDLSARQPLALFPGLGSPVAITPDGQLVAAVSQSRGLCLWRPGTTNLVTVSGAPYQGGGLAFSPDGLTLAFGGRKQKLISLWDVERGRLRATLAGLSHGVSVVTWSPDGKLLAAGGEDKSVHLWQVGQDSASWPEKVLPRGGMDRKLDPVSGCITARAGESLALWNPQTDRYARTLPGTEGQAVTGFLAEGRGAATGAPSVPHPLLITPESQTDDRIERFATAPRRLSFVPTGLARRRF